MRYLAALGLSVNLAKQGDLSIFAPILESGLPVVVRVKTLGWPHWGDEITEQAVVVVGSDQSNDVIYIHDPFFAEAPIELDLLRFDDCKSGSSTG